MSHNSDGMIYVNSPQGISIGDLQDVLSTSRKDLGGIITNVNINKWAKHKPFRNSSVGFNFSASQSTPEGRSPDRVTAALATNFGLTIPKYTPSQFKTNYSQQWTYDRPRGSASNEWFRLLDFDGYLDDCYWQIGSSGRNLFTIFNGTLTAADTLVFQGDSIMFEIQCAEDPDTGLPGLLYPYSFYEAMQTSRLDISSYYMGIALLDARNTLWLITGEDMRSHHSQDDVDAVLRAVIPTNFPQGDFQAIPVLASEVANPDPETGVSRWTSSPSGYLVSLNGASLTLKAGSAYGQLALNCSVTVNGRYITMDFMVRNITSSNVTVYGLDCYILSRASRSNEPDTGYPAPDSVAPGVDYYIEDNWRSNGSVPMSNPGYIYVTDWYDPDDPDYQPSTFPEGLAARRYNPWADFYAANGNSAVVRPGATYQVTWQKVFDTVTGEDDFGPYSGPDDAFAFVEMCVDVGAGTRYIQEFDNTEQYS